MKPAAFLRRRLLRLPAWLWLLLLALGIGFYFSLPDPLFCDPYSAVLEDRHGHLMGAKIARDGQWRFPEKEDIPEKFRVAITVFEDKRFAWHPGVDPISLLRASWQNIRAGHVVSGGSTLSMQVISLAKGRKAAGIGAKMLEIIQALRLECSFSKKKILALYAAHAPFGGNVVGLEAASWRYFGKALPLLSWGEAAMLAVLPNTPSLMHPGKNRQALKDKRNRLLYRLRDAGYISATDCSLACEESIPEAPRALPRLAPHLLETLARQYQSREFADYRFVATLDSRLQEQLNRVLENHSFGLRENQIHNAAALVLDIQQNEVVAYAGNIQGTGQIHQEAVDIVQARRSTGSLLKPFLYAQMLQESMILPNSIVPDIPTYINGFRPQNFFKTYDGVVTARRALIRSLNVPFTILLQDYGFDKFHYRLRQLGLQTIDQPPGHYGLSLILGGAETRLWDIANAYAYLGETVNHYQSESGRYFQSDLQQAAILQGEQKRSQPMRSAPLFGAGAAWAALDAMQHLERPVSEGVWEMFSSARPIAWKTGTSFGFRDAWSIGVSPRYVVAVWVGNADGEGRPGILGYEAAGPIMFDLFDLLPADGRFSPPYDDLSRIEVCKSSGNRAGPNCPIDSAWVPRSAVAGPVCTQHKIIHLDPLRDLQVNDQCMDPLQMRHEAWFVLSPVEEQYYKAKNPDFRPLPPWRDDCNPEWTGQAQLQWIYPRPGTQVLVPIDLDGKAGRVILKAAHRQKDAIVYWHIDREYIGSTRQFHELACNPLPGRHLLTLVDHNGLRISQWIEVLEKKN